MDIGKLKKYSDLAHDLSVTKRKEFYILDSNDNPCHIKDPNDFLSKLIERNQETLNTLSQLHDSLQRRK